MDKPTLQQKLSQAKISEARSVEAFLASRTSEKEINLSMMLASKKDFDDLCEFLENPNVKITHLDISSNNLALYDMPRFVAALGKQKQLSTLNLSNTKLSFDAMSVFAGYLKDPQTNLKKLEFRLNSDSVKQCAPSLFAALTQNKKLETVYLSSSLNNDSAKAFAKYLIESVTTKAVAFNSSGFDQKTMASLRNAFLVNDQVRKNIGIEKLARTTDFVALTNNVSLEEKTAIKKQADEITARHPKPLSQNLQTKEVEEQRPAGRRRKLPQPPSEPKKEGPTLSKATLPPLKRREENPLSPRKPLLPIQKEAVQNNTTPPNSPTRATAESPVTPTNRGTEKDPVRTA